MSRGPIPGELCPGCARRIRTAAGSPGCLWRQVDGTWRPGCQVTAPLRDVAPIPRPGPQATPAAQHAYTKAMVDRFEVGPEAAAARARRPITPAPATGRRTRTSRPRRPAPPATPTLELPIWPTGKAFRQKNDPCPVCGAQPGDQCADLRGRLRPAKTPHRLPGKTRP